MIVRLRGIKKARAKGRVYYYHRGTGTRLPDDPRSAAFIEAVARLEAAPRTASAAKAGTLGALIAAYRTSPECRRLADRTRHDYELVFNYLKPLDGMPLLQLDSAAVIGIRDKAFEQKKRRFANHVLQVLGTILNWGRPRKLAPATNPAIGIPKLPRPRDLPPANRDWSDEETDAVLGAANGGLKVAVSLAIYAGMRGGDIARVTWSAYNGTVLEWKQGKTGAEVWLPCLPELKRILEAAPRTATTIATQRNGRPMTEAGLRKAFRTLILRLMRQGSVAPGLTLHGRRHTLANQLTDRGADPRMVQAVLGHKSMAASLHYSNRADRRRAATAAVHLLTTENGTRPILENWTDGNGKPPSRGG
jgi:integrase